jgi:hypothetical protein
MYWAKAGDGTTSAEKAMATDCRRKRKRLMIVLSRWKLSNRTERLSNFPDGETRLHPAAWSTAGLQDRDPIKTRQVAARSVGMRVVCAAPPALRNASLR